MSQMLENIEYLSEGIGGRPAGTEEEHQAALYITEQFQKDTGFPVVMEDFVTASNVPNIKAVSSAVVVLCALLAMLTPVPTLVWFLLALVATVVFVLEALDKPVVSARLARGASQNVVAKYQPNPDAANQRRTRKVVLLARYDSGKEKSALVERAEATGLPLGRMAGIGLIAVVALLLVRMIAFSHATGITLIIINILTVLAMLVAALPLVKAVAIGIKKGYNAGANNNASGVAVLLEVARRISRGSVSEADLAAEPYEVRIHTEEEARATQYVPEGTRIVYESAKLKPPYNEPNDDERLATAKAALAAFTGVPGARWEPNDIADKLVQAHPHRGRAEGSYGLEEYDVPPLPADGQYDDQELYPQAPEGYREESDPFSEEEAAKEAPLDKYDALALQLQAEPAAETPADGLRNMRSLLPSVGIEAASSIAVTEKIERISAEPDQAAEPKEVASVIEEEKLVEPAVVEAVEGAEAEAEVEEPAEPAEAVEEKPAYTSMWAQFTAESAQKEAARPAVVVPVAAAVNKPAPEPEPAPEPAPEPQPETPEHGFTGELPDWFVSAQRKANKQETQTGPIKRSKFATALADAERDIEEQARLVREQREEEARALIAHQSAAVAASVQAAAEPVEPAPTEEPASDEPAVDEQPAARVLAVPSIELPQEKPAAAPAPIEEPAPSRSGLFRRLRADLPSLAGDDLSLEEEPSYSAISVVGEEDANSELAHSLEPLGTIDWDDEAEVGGARDAAPAQDLQSTSAFEFTHEEFVAAMNEGYARGSEPEPEPLEEEPAPRASRERADRSSNAGGRRKAFSSNKKKGGFSEPVRSKGLLSLFRRNKEEELSDSPQEWLDVDDDFEARSVGRKRGGWESFRDESYDDYDDYEDFEDDEPAGSKWNGGAYSRVRLGHVDTRSSDISDVLPVIPEDPDELQLTGEIERIYHFRNPNFTTEVWFVALGAELNLHDGAKAFLAEHRNDLRGSNIIEVESLGAGELSLVEEEGQFRSVPASRRIARYADKAADAFGFKVPRVRLLNSDSAASTLIKGGSQAVHLAGMEGSRPSMLGSRDDVIENIDEQLLQDNVEYLVELIRRY